MSFEKIAVGIVDDHTLFREGLTTLLNERDRFNVVFSAGNGIEMQTEILNKGIPSVILMDINMPIMDGPSATAWLKSNYPNVHVLALSMYEDELSIIGMVRKGAGGYLVKESNANELSRGILAINESGYYFNDFVSGSLLRSLQSTQSSSLGFPSLSPREQEFLEFACTEMTYKEIADRMNVSVRTVDGYRDALFEKLNSKSRIGLVLFAIKNKLVKIA